MLNLRHWVGLVAAHPIDHQVNVLLFVVCDRVLVSNRDNALDFDVLFGRETFNLQVDLAQPLVFEGVLDAVLDDDVLVEEVLLDGDDVFRAGVVDLDYLAGKLVLRILKECSDGGDFFHCQIKGVFSALLGFWLRSASLGLLGLCLWLAVGFRRRCSILDDCCGDHL